MKIKKLLMNIALYAGMFGVSSASTVFILKANNKAPVVDVPEYAPKAVNETAGQKLLNSLLGYNAIEVSGEVKLGLENNTNIDVELAGQAKFSDISNIQVLADINAKIDGFSLSGEIGYFDNMLSVALDDLAYFKLKTDDLMDFIDMIPTYGLNIELPSSLTGLGLDTLTSLTSIEEADRKLTPNNEYYYEFNLGEGEDAICLYILTDLDNRLLGVRTDTIYFNSTKISINLLLNEISDAEFTASDPLKGENADLYQDFKPIFTVVDDIFKLTDLDNLGVNLAVNVSKFNDDLLEYEKLVDVTLDSDLDLANKKFGFDINVKENDRSHDLFFGYVNQNIYASFHNVNIKIETETISTLIELLIKNLDLSSLLEGIDLGGIDIGSIGDMIKNLIGDIKLSSNNVSIDLDLSSFGLEMDPIKLTLSFDESGLKSLTTSDIVIGKVKLNLAISLDEYNDFTIDESNYSPIDRAYALAKSVIDLLKQKQIRIELEGLFDNADETKQDVTLNGGLQFDVDNKYGYGEINIIDSDNYLHNIKADMSDGTNFLFNYNESINPTTGLKEGLFGKFTSDTLKDLVGLVIDIVKNPDEHMMELLNGLLSSAMDSILVRALLTGDYALLLESDIISNLVVNNEKFAMDVSLVFVGFDTSLHLEIAYDFDIDSEDAKLKSITLSNLKLGNTTINLTANIKPFEANRDQTDRLTDFEERLDFSDIKVLLELGINTSKFNYYHFTSTASILIETGILKIDIKEFDLDLDVKIRNEKGNVKVAVEIGGLPTTFGIFSNYDYLGAENRKASIYYADGLIYLERNESVKKSVFGGRSDYKYQAIYTTDYFFANIVNILLEDVLSLTKLATGIINKSGTSSEETKQQIHYEKLINNFNYVDNNSKPYFDVDINMEEILHSSIISSLNAKITTNPEDNTLDGINASMVVSVGLTIQIKLPLKLEQDKQIEVFNYDEDGNIISQKEGTILTGLENAFSTYFLEEGLDHKIIHNGLVK